MTNDSIDLDEQWRAVLSAPVNVQPFDPPSAAISLEVGGASSCGSHHLQNHEHYLAIRIGRLQETLTTTLRAADLPSRFEEYAYALLVADGLGDDGSAARASRVALSTLAHLAIRYGKWNVRVDADTPSQIIDQGEFFYRQANDAVFQAGRASPGLAAMATSLTALYVAQDDLFFAHVGQSRAYLLRSGALIQLTPGRKPEQVRRSESPRGPRSPRHVGQVIAQMIGRHTAPDVEIERIKLSSGDRLLLCTNGLTDAVDEEQIADSLASWRHPKEDCLRLIEMARGEGSADDVTVMLGDYMLRRQ